MPNANQKAAAPNPIPVRTLRTGVELTAFGFGGAPLGKLSVPGSEEQAQDTLRAAWEAGIRYYDTAPVYGNGKSEHRLGQFLRQQPREEFVLSSKVGRVFTATGNQGINVVAIAQGSSECSISLVVQDRDGDDAVRAIHELVIEG